MANKGASPIDKSTLVGQVRLNVGDTASVPLDPAQPGFADYANFSDDELESLLISSGDNVIRATAWAYGKLATLAAAAPGGSVTIKTNDLGYTSKREEALLKLADWWSAQADNADAEASDDLLEIVAYPGRNNANPVLPRLV